MSATRWSDRRIVLWMGAVMLLLIIVLSVLAPSSAEDDPRPTTSNAGPQGAKAAFMTLEAIGRQTSRWQRPFAELNQLDAPHTTLVLAAPSYAATEQQAIAAAVKQFLERGGRVLTTGSMGALLLPGGKVEPPTAFMTGLCHTKPVDGPLAAAGSVTLVDGGKWAGKESVQIAHRCGTDAVVVQMTVGRGEAVWWASATPLTNAQLQNDGNLRLLLLSLGGDRAVVWNESVQEPVPSLWSAARGLPLWWLVAQAVLIGVLLVLSFSRRNGPLRSPVIVPRSSPVEFASSMGDLYEKARATTAATDAAKRRLLRAIQRDAGVSQAIVEQGQQAIVIALNERLGGDWTFVGAHIEKANETTERTPTQREALTISRALSEDAEAIRRAARRGRARTIAAIRTV